MNGTSPRAAATSFFVRAKRQHRRKVAAHLDRELAILKGQYHTVYQFDPKTRAVFVPAEWLVGEPFNEYALACGAILARAHARTGDAAKIAGYCGKSEEFGGRGSTSPTPIA